MEADYDIEFTENRPRLDATVRIENLTSADAYQILGQVVMRAAEKHCSHILIECGASTQRSADALEDAIDSLAAMNFPGKIAFVNCHGDSHEPGRLAPNLHLFEDRRPALQWLTATA